MWNFTLLIPDECDTRQECGCGDKPDGSQEREKLPKEHEKNYMLRKCFREPFKFPWALFGLVIAMRSNWFLLFMQASVASTVLAGATYRDLAGGL